MYIETDSMEVGCTCICTELAMQVATPIRHKAALLRLERRRETALTPLSIDETYCIQS